MKTFVYGVPGSGKTYYSRALGKKFNIPVFEADKLKKKSSSRILSTCLAYTEFGNFSPENVIKGLLLVRDTYREVVEQEIMKHDKLILEGAFLDPISLLKFGKPILLICPNEVRHKRQFLMHREKLLDFHGNEFKVARIIQKFLIAEAKKLQIKIVKNATQL